MSKTKIKSINFSIYEFMKRYKNSMSFAHRYGMTNRLTAMFKELHEMGYEPTHIGRVKPKHVELLVKHWQTNGISNATIKNRMSDLRFVCRAFQRQSVLKSNEAYGIERRSYIPTENKAIHHIDLSVVNDQHLRASFELQRLFGLRREECLKLIPSVADQGHLLYLKGSWTKGGIERWVPILTGEQRHWLDYAKKLVGRGKSLIPEGKTYIQQRHSYDNIARQIRPNLHGLRHAYAQRRYRDITGWECPLNDGPASRSFETQAERSLDELARQTISSELGHGRIQIVKSYCG